MLPRANLPPALERSFAAGYRTVLQPPPPTPSSEPHTSARNEKRLPKPATEPCRTDAVKRVNHECSTTTEHGNQLCGLSQRGIFRSAKRTRPLRLARLAAKGKIAALGEIENNGSICERAQVVVALAIHKNA